MASVSGICVSPNQVLIVLKHVKKKKKLSKTSYFYI